ncbi:Phosphatidylglycerol--prolipoprotein diacylglyceryl transferase [Sporomusa carbonis]|uniref:prolipoprotein diacylglyceryl transferase n=1 Tax=Sporomusa carbonis TaxID=3076075 RepID=UPI003A74CB2D
MGKWAFSIGPVNFSWFGIILATAILAAFSISWWQVRLRNENSDILLDLTLYNIPMGIIAARLYYVWINWQLYVDDPSEIPKIWHGGLAIHGALIGIILTTLIYSRIYKISFWYWADIVAPGVIFGQAIGQWGNFVNQDAFGYPTDAPWGIYIDYAYRPPSYEQFDFFHPIFLYQSLWDLLVFVILIAMSWWMIKKPGKLAHGSLFLMYIILYSAGRLVIESFRIDSEMIGSCRIAQVISGIAIVWAGVFLSQRYHKILHWFKPDIRRKGSGPH